MDDFKNKHKVYGLINSPDDMRDYELTKLIARAIKLPDKYMNPTPLIILDQGNVGCCVGCAGAQAKHIIEYNQTGDNEMFSPMYLYGNRQDGDYFGSGMIPREFLKNLKKFGMCHEKYFNGYYECEEAYLKYLENKEFLDEKAYPYRISSYYRLRNMNDIKTAIYTIGFAFVAYDVYECLYYPDKDGLIHYDPNDTTNLGGHQMLAIGYCEEGLIVVNSWSKDYGKDGVIIIPYEYEPTESWALLDYIKETEIKEMYGEE